MRGAKLLRGGLVRPGTLLEAILMASFARVAGAGFGNLREDAIEIKLPSRPGRSKPRKAEMLEFKTSLERMAAVNLGEIFRDLGRFAESLAGNKRRRAQLIQAGYAKGRQT